MQMFAYLLTTGVTTGALYALIAIGLVVVYKSAGVINFAHGEQLMLGGFFAYSLHVLADLAYMPALLLAIAGALGLGILTYWVGFRPVMRHGLISVLLATIGVLSVACGRLTPRAPGPAAEALAPSFRLPDQRGNTLTLSQLKAAGPVVVVFYRGHW